MSKSTVTITAVDIHRFLGCRPGSPRLSFPKETFSSGINILYGPNGSGKTTLARSILGLLWPNTDTHKDAWIEGSWDLNATPWDVNVNAGTASYTASGEQVEQPPFPPSEWQNRYYLALHELLIANDRELLKQIRDEVHGGVDLDKAKELLGFDVKIPAGNCKEVLNVKHAESKVRKITAEHQKLQDEEKELQELTEKESLLKGKDRRNRRLEKVIACRKAAAEKKLFEKRLQEFHPSLTQLSGDDGQKWEEWDTRCQELEQQLTAAKQKQSEALEAKKGTDLNKLPDDSDLQRLHEYLQTLPKLELKVETLQGEIAECNRKEEILRAGIHQAVPKEKLLELELYGYENLQEWQSLVAENRSEKKFGELLDQLQSKLRCDVKSDHENTSRWITRLTDWLAKPDKLSGKGWVYGYGIIFLSSLFGLGSVAFLQNNIILNASLLTLFISGSWLVNTLWKYQRQIGSKKIIEKELSNSLSPQPFFWERNKVTHELRQLIKSSQKEAFQGELQSFIATHFEAHKQKMAQIQGKLARYQKEVFSVYPIELDTENPSLALFFDKLRNWQEMYRAQEGIAAKLEEAKNKLQDTLKACNKILSQYFPNNAVTCADVSGYNATLYSKVKTWKECEQQEQHCIHQIQQHEKEQKVLTKKKEDLLKKIHPEYTEQTQYEAKTLLFDLIKKKDEYDHVQGEFQQRKHHVAQLELETQLDEAETEQSLDQLEQHLENREQVENELQNVRDTITQIKTRIELAKSKHDLADALALRDDAYQELQKLYEKTCASVIGSKIIRFAIERSTKHASEVLTRARELFGMITRHQYELLIGDTHEMDFKARDTLTDRIMQLNELSSGTRIQLLLSVRVAFIEAQEGHNPRMPLLLDEVLGNSDDERTEAIIEAIVTLAKGGRQIFYFTAQSDEVKRWMCHLSKTKEIAYTSPITLPIGEPVSSESWIEESEPESSIPIPAQMSYAEYGQALEVSPINSTPIQQAHLWHFFDNTETLYNLLQLGYERWGQLETFVKIHGDECLGKLNISNDSTFWPKAQALASSFAKASELAQQGKGQKIDDVILANSGCISASYLKKMIDLNQEVEGDAKELIERLENKAIPRYRKEKIDALKDYLAEHDYLDPRKALTPEEIKQELDAFVANQDFLSKGFLTIANLNSILKKY